MNKFSLTQDERVLFEYYKEFEMTHNRLSEELAERLAFDKIKLARESAKKNRYVEYNFNGE